MWGGGEWGQLVVSAAASPIWPLFLLQAELSFVRDRRAPALSSCPGHCTSMICGWYSVLFKGPEVLICGLMAVN